MSKKEDLYSKFLNFSSKERISVIENTLFFFFLSVGSLIVAKDVIFLWMQVFWLAIYAISMGFLGYSLTILFAIELAKFFDWIETKTTRRKSHQKVFSRRLMRRIKPFLTGGKNFVLWLTNVLIIPLIIYLGAVFLNYLQVQIPNLPEGTIFGITAAFNVVINLIINYRRGK